MTFATDDQVDVLGRERCSAKQRIKERLPAIFKDHRWREAAKAVGQQ